jgi:hypothetical protein
MELTCKLVFRKLPNKPMKLTVGRGRPPAA